MRPARPLRRSPSALPLLLAAALCGCGNVGDVESLVAGNAIPRRWGAEGFTDASALFKACQAGDARALEKLDDMCHIMGRLLFNLIALGDLSRISLGGSVFWHHRVLLLPLLQAQVDGRLAALTAGALLVPAGLGEQVGDYAALALTV